MPSVSFNISAVRRFFQRIAFFALLGLTLVSVSTTIAAALGQLDWISITVTTGGSLVANAGMYLQIGVNAFLIGLCFFLPTNARIFSLETSHRRFAITMDDVAAAYQSAHHADRSGAFATAREFDSMRDQMAYLRDHPDLAQLEPGLLELAAQMSHESRDLADIYSDEKIERASAFLRQRKQELEAYQDRITAAHRATSEIKERLAQIDLDENIVEAQLDRLESDLREVLPLVGLDVVSLGKSTKHKNVFEISSKDKIANARSKKSVARQEGFETVNVTPAE